MSFYADRIFPHVLDLATRPFWPQRKEVIAEACGRVLEIGIGTGANLAHYGSEAHAKGDGFELVDAVRQAKRRGAYDEATY